jgi:hypothetical protein
VRNCISQSQVFALCAFGGFGAAVYLWRANFKRHVVALVLVSVGFLCKYHDQNASTSMGILAQINQVHSKGTLDRQWYGIAKTLFERDAVGKKEPRQEATGNPPNQTLNVAVPWGLLGCLVLYGMWLVHLKMFLTPGLISWIGLAAVIENFASSLFNSHRVASVEGSLRKISASAAERQTQP